MTDELAERVTLLTEALTAAQFVLSIHLATLQADRVRYDPTGEGDEIVGETLAQIDALIGPYEPGKYFRTLQAARDQEQASRLDAEVEHLRAAGTIAPGDERMRLMRRINHAAKAFDRDDEEPTASSTFCSECGMTLDDCCDPPLCCACGDSPSEETTT